MGWLTGWACRKEFTISRPSGAASNHAFPIYIGEAYNSSGAGEGATYNVHCNRKCLSNFYDIRVTTSDGETLVPQAIERTYGTSGTGIAKIYFKFPTISTTGTTYYLYFGNSSATSVFSGKDVFKGYEDFEWGSDGTSISTSGGSITWNSSNTTISTTHPFTGTRSAKLSHNPSYPWAAGTLTASENNAFRIYVYREGGDVFFPLLHGNNTYAIYFNIFAMYSDKIYYYDTSYHDTGKQVTGGTYHFIDIKNINFTTGTYDIDVDASGSFVTCNMSPTGSYENKILFEGDSALYNHWVDLIIVRDYLSTEATLGTFGDEESEGITLYTDSSGLNPVSSPPYTDGYVVKIFKSSGTFTLLSSKNVDYFIAGGGAAGGWYGGGGAGGYKTGTALFASGVYTITIGTGGSPSATGFEVASVGNGSPSSVVGGTISITADEGGGGGNSNFGGHEEWIVGANGASGGGAGSNAGADYIVRYGGSGISGQGYAGGTCPGNIGSPCGGGGGAGSVGGNASFSPGNGGDGILCSLSGTPSYYCGGGGGGDHNDLGYGLGGSGIGGNGGTKTISLYPTSGSQNTGSGGGGGVGGSFGGDGIVILRYLYSRSYLSWNGGTPVEITGDGDFTLTDTGGETMSITADYSAIPTTDKNDNITIATTKDEQKGLLRVSPNVVGRTAIDNYIPTKFFPWGNEIKLEPVPDAEYTINLYISDYPTTILSSDTDSLSALPEEFHECSVYFSCYVLCVKMKKWNMAKNFYNRYLKSLEDRYKIYMQRKVENRIPKDMPSISKRRREYIDESNKKTIPDIVLRRR